MEGGDCYKGNPISFASSGHTLYFLRLRILAIKMLRLSGSSVLDTLLGSGTKVCHLQVSTMGDNIAGKFFAKRGNIPTFETLACTSGEPANFIYANPQVRKLTIGQLGPSRMPSRWFSGRCSDVQIVGSLSKSFHNLSSLSLIWDEDFIPEYALEYISTINNLSSLHLSAGVRVGFSDYNWVINHKKPRRHISRLKSLRNLAISGDTYESEIHHSRYRYEPSELHFEPQDNEDSENNEDTKA